MPSLASIRSSNASFKPTYGRPVGIFVGGTSGIGAGMASRFAQYTKGDADVVIVGRNRAAAEALLAAMPTGPGGEPAPKREFVACDATLMKDVGRVAGELGERYPKINFLVCSQGMMTLNGRDETEEGIDKKLALHYYSRWKFIHDLVPQLKAAKDAGEDAKVMSVLAAGYGGAVDTEDFGLKKNYSVSAAALATPTYNDCMIEAFASRHPGLSFVHAHPGWVDTSLVKNMTGFGSSVLGPLSTLIAGLVATSPETCGDYMWHGLFNAAPGWSRTGAKGGPVTGRLFNDSVVEKLWEHTTVETKTAA